MNTTEIDTQTDEDIAIETSLIESEETKKKLLSKVDEEGQVIVNCKIAATFFDNVARIWETTFLIERKSNHRSLLIYIEGITKYPVWTEIPVRTTLYFRLIFSALPKSCKVFDFLEQIPEPGGFNISNIKRTRTDVYHVDLT